MAEAATLVAAGPMGAPPHHDDAGRACALLALIPAVDLMLRQAAAGQGDVLVRGAVGTGKELFARALHARSRRAAAPFVRIVCGAAGPAAADVQAWLAEASEGTLFLDEIADLAPPAQQALLRALQLLDAGTRYAARRPGPRLVCASARALETLVMCGEFRADLYHRLHVITVALPALGDLSAGEIHALAAGSLARYNAATGRSLRFSRQALRRLERCRPPGNLRELENCVESAASLTATGTIAAGSLPCACCLAHVQGPAADPSGARPRRQDLVARQPAAPPLAEPHLAAQRSRIVTALERCGWVQAKAARMLGLTPRQISYAIQQLDIELQQL